MDASYVLGPSWTKAPFTRSRLPPRRKARCAALLGLDKLFRSGASPAQQQPLLDDQPDLEPHFQQWLKQQGVSTQPLLLRQCGREGRGLVADRALPRGEPLLQLPDSMLITPQRAAEESCMAPLLRQLPSSSASTSSSAPSTASTTSATTSASSPSPPPPPLPLPEWSLLALYLAELRGRLAAGDVASRWAPYVAMLPQRPGTVLEWPAKEARQLLRGSPLLRLADSISAAAAASWAELEPLVQQARSDGLLPPHVPMAKSNLEWAFGVLLSRCIRLPGRGQVQVLAPWADLLNHDVGAQEGCHLDWEPGARGGAGGLVLRADRAYSAGQQVYVSYGPKSSGELLLSYGFCPPPAANPHQDFKLLVGVDPRVDPLAELKTKELARHGLPPSMEFPLKLEGLPGGLLQYLAFVEARPHVAQETSDLASLLFGSGSFPLLDGADTLELALRSLGARCGAALKEYPTSMETDQALAAGAVAAVVNRPPRGPRRAAAATHTSSAPNLSPPPRGSATAAATSAATAAATAVDGSAGVTLSTEDVLNSNLRAAAVAGIRVRERQILQRSQAAASGQLAEVRRAARARRR